MRCYGLRVSRDEERAAEEHERARWLKGAVERAGLTVAEIARYVNYSTPMVHMWLLGRAAPTPQAALDLAALLGVPGLDALRASGHAGLADRIVYQLGAEGDWAPPPGIAPLPPRPEDRYVGGMEPHEPERYEPTFDGVLAAIAALGERMDRRFAGVYGKIGNVDADIDALMGLARTHQRELRELSARFDRIAIRVDRRFDRVDAEFGQVLADIAALKTETALVESSVEAVGEQVQRHLDDPAPHADHAA